MYLHKTLFKHKYNHSLVVNIIKTSFMKTISVITFVKCYFSVFVIKYSHLR